MMAQAVPQAGPDIVVRGRRTREALEACIARNCSTLEDARLAMAHAEAQFAEGKYKDASRTLRASLSRQSSQAKKYPRVIAALHEADATVNLHYGDMNRFRSATIERAAVLRENLPESDPEVLTMTVQLGDFWIRQRSLPDARRQFESASKRYSLRGEPHLAALCDLRLVALDIAERRFSNAGKRLDRIGGASAATHPSVRLLHAVMRARLAAARGQDVDMGALLATLRADASAPPVLVLPGKSVDETGFDTKVESRDGTSVLWADIGFMVGADGRVSDVEVLRGNRSRTWTAPYAAEIAGRTYMPMTLAANQPGVYRVERYTLRSDLGVPLGSLITQRAGPARAQVLDLTRDSIKPRDPA